MTNSKKCQRGSVRNREGIAHPQTAPEFSHRTVPDIRVMSFFPLRYRFCYLLLLLQIQADFDSGVSTFRTFQIHMSKDLSYFEQSTTVIHKG